MTRRRAPKKQTRPRGEAGKDEIEASTASHRAIATFIILFVAISAAGIGLEYYLMKNDSAQSYRALVAEAGNALPAAFGIEADVDGSVVRVGGRRLRVTPECSGVEAIGIFLAGVIAFPCGRRRTLIGIAIGFVGVGLLNVLRISVLIITSSRWPDAFEPVHDALTHLFPLFAVLPLWLAWMLIAFRRGKGAGGDAADDTPTGDPSSASPAQPAKGE